MEDFMKIEFFLKENKNLMDERAIGGGVYHIELLNGKKSVSLYIGESIWMAERCGRHLYRLFRNPGYMGLSADDLNNNELTLRFSILHTFNERKSILGDKVYKDKELEFIKKIRPLTQLETSDKQINNKFNVVQKEMRKQGIKS